jgi:hypothetical protein
MHFFILQIRQFAKDELPFLSFEGNMAPALPSTLSFLSSL